MVRIIKTLDAFLGHSKENIDPTYEKECEMPLGTIGLVIPIFSNNPSDGEFWRDHFAEILSIEEINGKFIHILRKLPELTQEEKTRRVNLNKKKEGRD